jgi:hypothetical protein
MRTWLLLSISLIGCGQVSARHNDAAIDTASGSASDASTDTPPAIDATTLLTPSFHWSFENNTNNTGSVNGFALSTPAGISYVTGKDGMAASYGNGQYSLVAGMRAQLGVLPKVTFAFWLKEPGNLSSVAVLDIINRNTSPFGGIQFGFGGTTASMCVATTSNSGLSGGCGGPTAPSANVWHHWILRYNGSGTGAGQGGPTEVYVDDVLVDTRPNDAANDPVFTTAIPDNFYLGAPGTVMDEVKVFATTYDVATQCTGIIGGTYAGSTCTLP